MFSLSHRIFSRRLALTLIAAPAIFLPTLAHAAGVPSAFMYDSYSGALFQTPNFANGTGSFNSSGTFTNVGTENHTTSAVHVGGVALDHSNDLFTAQGNGISEITSSGTTLFVDPSSNSFSNPGGIAFDHSGNLYVADSGDNAIKKVDSSGHVTTFATTGLNDPTDLAFDSSGNLYVANSGANNILVFNSSAVGTPLSLNPGNVTLLNPFSLAFDPQGNLFVSTGTQNNIDKITFGPSGNTLSHFLTGDAGIQGIATDNLGNVYFADTLNDDLFEIQKVTPSGIPSLFFMSNNDAISTPQFLALGPASSTLIPEPTTTTLAALTALSLLCLPRRRKPTAEF
jgi:sugar lactone lactonase YvrE